MSNVKQLNDDGTVSIPSNFPRTRRGPDSRGFRLLAQEIGRSCGLNQGYIIFMDGSAYVYTAPSKDQFEDLCASLQRGRFFNLGVRRAVFGFTRGFTPPADYEVIYEYPPYQGTKPDPCRRIHFGDWETDGFAAPEYIVATGPGHLLWNAFPLFPDEGTSYVDSRERFTNVSPDDIIMHCQHVYSGDWSSTGLANLSLEIWDVFDNPVAGVTLIIPPDSTSGTILFDYIIPAGVTRKIRVYVTTNENTVNASGVVDVTYDDPQ